MTDIVCISPVDGREVARRRDGFGRGDRGAVAAARKAQAAWARAARRARQALPGLRRRDAGDARRDRAGARLADGPAGALRRRRAGRLRGTRPLHDRASPKAPWRRLCLRPKQGFRRYVRREPLGIVLTVAPWNYPYLTAVNSVMPALMAGNAVLLKHAAQTMLVGDRFQAAMDRAGLPKGLFRTLVSRTTTRRS